MKTSPTLVPHRAKDCRTCSMSFGEPHHHFDSIDSTNTRARELAAEGAEHGTVVTAAEQTAGRGRQGRTGPRRRARPCSTRPSSARSTSAT